MAAISYVFTVRRVGLMLDEDDETLDEVAEEVSLLALTDGDIRAGKSL